MNAQEVSEILDRIEAKVVLIVTALHQRIAELERENAELRCNANIAQVLITEQENSKLEEECDQLRAQVVRLREVLTECVNILSAPCGIEHNKMHWAKARIALNELASDATNTLLRPMMEAMVQGLAYVEGEAEPEIIEQYCKELERLQQLLK